MRLEPRGQEIGKDERVAGGGVDGVERDAAAGAMIGMIEELLTRPTGRWVLTHDDSRAEAPDLADDLVPQLERGLEDPVLVIAAVRELGLAGRRNTCMARGLKALASLG